MSVKIKPRGSARQQLFARLKRKKADLLGRPGEAIVRRGETRSPLSFAQERLWFLDRFEPGSPRFSILTAIRFRGTLNTVALAKSLTEVVRRHEVMRTVFEQGQLGPRQVILPPVPVVLPVVDLEALGKDSVESWIQNILTAEAQCPFDLERGPLMRVFLLRLGPSEHVLALTLHQIISDRWSRGVFVGEMSALYQAFSEDAASPLEELEIQYADFARWQREKLSGEHLVEKLEFWRKTLRDLPTFEWPLDRPRPAISGYRGKMVFSVLPKDLLDRLKAFSQQQGCTLFMTLLSALAALGHRYTGQRDLIFGTPMASRTPRQTEPLMGFFLNLLPLRVQCDRRRSFERLVEQATRSTVAAFSQQDLPFALLVRHLVDGRDLSRHPLFQTTLVLQNTPMPPIEVGDLEWSLLPVDWGTTAFDLAFFFWETALWEGIEDGLSIITSYSRDLYDAVTIERLGRSLLHLLEGVMDDPQRPIGELPPLDSSSRAALALTTRSLERISTDHLVELFEQQVADHAAAIAVQDDDEQVSYEALYRRAVSLRLWLEEQGVSAESPVLICLQPGVERTAAQLAVLLVGGACSPIDPDWPSSHRERVIDQMGARFGFAEPVSQTGMDAICWLDPALWHRESASASTRIEPTQVAYLLSTSGSTGEAKSVALSHGALAALARHPGVNVQAEDASSHLASSAFDAALFELWATWANGARVVVGRSSDLLDAASLASWRRRHRISVQFLTTSWCHRLVDQDASSFADLRCLVFGGEEARPDAVRSLRAACPNLGLHHAYGPTEATVFATVARLDEDPEADVPLGHTLPGRHLHLLDRDLKPVPEGGLGEICLAGLGLGRGYFGSPGRTALHFVPDPFGEDGGRLYRTGDRALVSSTGELRFRGRLDRQIKIRGFRIEPGQIEQLLRRLPGVGEARIVQCEIAGEAVLIAFVSTVGEEDPEGLRLELRRRLPAAWVPRRMMLVEDWPRLANGKIDSKALLRRAERLPSPSTSTPPRPPRSVWEKRLTALMTALLTTPEIGLDDDFFDLGGHSLLAAELVHRLRRDYGVELEVRQLFEHSQVERLASLLDQRQPNPNLVGAEETR